MSRSGFQSRGDGRSRGAGGAPGDGRSRDSSSVRTSGNREPRIAGSIKKESVDRPFARQLSPAAIYGGLMLLAAFLVSLRFPPSDFRLTVLFFACIALQWTLRMWAATPILILVLASLFFGERRTFSGLDHSTTEIITAGAVVLLLLASGRFLTLGVPVIPWNANLRTKFDRVWNRFVMGKPLKMDRSLLDARSPRLFSVSELITGFLRVVVAVVVATQVLEFMPIDSELADSVKLTPRWVRAISITLGLLTVVVLINILLSTLSWRRLSASEARVYLNSQLSQECHREIAAVFRVEQRQRRSRRV